MDFNIDNNIIKFHNSINDIAFNEFGLTSSFLYFDSNRITGFYLESSDFTATSLSNVNIELINYDTNEIIDFKTEAGGSEFDYQLNTETGNYMLVYKSSKILDDNIDEGHYYFKIYDTNLIKYSDSFCLKDIGYEAGLTKEYLITYEKQSGDTGQLTVKLTNTTETGDIDIDWGDGNTNTFGFVASGTTITKTNTYATNEEFTVKISSNLDIVDILEIFDTDRRILNVANGQYFTNLTELKIYDTDITSINFNEYQSLELLKISNTLISSLSGLESSATTLTELDADNCTQINVNSDFFEQLVNIETLDLEDCGISAIKNGSFKYGFYSDIQSINYENCNFSSIPNLGGTSGGGFTNLTEFNISSNLLKGNITLPATSFFENAGTYDFSNNAISTSIIDSILEKLYNNNSDLSSLVVSLDGFNKNTPSQQNGTPTRDLTTVSIVSGGTNYVVGDLITPTDGGGSGAYLYVSSVNSGVIDGIAYTQETGTGATITISTVDGSGAITLIAITTNGSGYSAGDVIYPNGGTGAGFIYTITSVNSSGAILTGGITSQGLGYTASDVVNLEGGGGSDYTSKPTAFSTNSASGAGASLTCRTYILEITDAGGTVTTN